MDIKFMKKATISKCNMEENSEKQWKIDNIFEALITFKR